MAFAVFTMSQSCVGWRSLPLGILLADIRKFPGAYFLSYVSFPHFLHLLFRALLQMRHLRPTPSRPETLKFLPLFA